MPKHTGRLPQEEERKEREEGMARKRAAPPTMNASAAVSSVSFRSPLLSSFPLEMADQPGQPCLNVSPWPYFGNVYGTGVTRHMEGFARCPAAHAWSVTHQLHVLQFGQAAKGYLKHHALCAECSSVLLARLSSWLYACHPGDHSGGHQGRHCGGHQGQDGGGDGGGHQGRRAWLWASRLARWRA